MINKIYLQENLKIYEKTTSENSTLGIPSNNSVDLSKWITKAIEDGLIELPNNVLNSDKHYVHNQTSPSDNWIIVHNLSKKPSVIVQDSAGTEVIGNIDYMDSNNTLKLIFSAPFSGKAYLN